ncbi:MAG: 5'/3'-nucleotidase SurE [Chloroflexi bacterium]|nr:5'/3'-nucleotidase SurE [Chloroflexota bacterium]
MRILVTNDDGIHSEGLDFLIDELKKIADVTVIAPDRERSATGHSLTFFKPVRLVKIDDKNGGEMFACSGTPTDCVFIGILNHMKTRPDLVISGINRGGNMGDDITYSGTVSAAVEGLIQGVPSFAISVAEYDADVRYDYAAFFARMLAQAILENGLPENTLLNVNVPNLAPEEIKGWMITKQGHSVYGQHVEKRTDPRGVEYYWLSGDTPRGKIEEGTDFAAVKNGYVSITPLQLDLTNHDIIEELKKWHINGL